MRERSQLRPAVKTGTGFGLGLGTLDEDAPLSIAFQREQPGRLAVGSYPVFDTTGDGESTPASLMAV